MSDTGQSSHQHNHGYRDTHQEGYAKKEQYDPYGHTRRCPVHLADAYYDQVVGIQTEQRADDRYPTQKCYGLRVGNRPERYRTLSCSRLRD